MKKKLIVLSLIFILLVSGLFILTGCNNGKENNGSNNDLVTVNGVSINLNNERTLCNMTFKYPEEAKFLTEEANHLTMKIYQDDNEEKILASVVLTVRTGENTEEYVKYMRDVEPSELENVTYGGVKWYIYDYSAGDAIAKVYYGQNGQDTYVISFPQEGEAQSIDITSFRTEFMNNISFGN